MFETAPPPPCVVLNEPQLAENIGAVARVMAVPYQAAVDTMFGYVDAYPGTDPMQYAAALTDLLLAAVVVPRPAAHRRRRDGVLRHPAHGRGPALQGLP